MLKSILIKGLVTFALGWVGLRVTIFAMMFVCELKLLPWSYCGEITGMINILMTGFLVTGLITLGGAYSIAREVMNNYKIVRK